MPRVKGQKEAERPAGPDRGAFPTRARSPDAAANPRKAGRAGETVQEGRKWSLIHAFQEPSGHFVHHPSAPPPPPRQLE